MKSRADVRDSLTSGRQHGGSGDTAWIRRVERSKTGDNFRIFADMSAEAVDDAQIQRCRRKVRRGPR